MKSQIVGSLKKGNISLVEYEDSRLFIQNGGVVGFFLTEQEAQDMLTLLNYYLNLEEINACEMKIGEKYVAIQ